jgi:hypothetical protein
MRCGRKRASREACQTNDEQGGCKTFAVQHDLDLLKGNFNIPMRSGVVGI